MPFLLRFGEHAPVRFLVLLELLQRGASLRVEQQRGEDLHARTVVPVHAFARLRGVDAAQHHTDHGPALHRHLRGGRPGQTVFQIGFGEFHREIMVGAGLGMPCAA